MYVLDEKTGESVVPDQEPEDQPEDSEGNPVEGKDSLVNIRVCSSIPKMTVFVGKVKLWFWRACPA